MLKKLEQISTRLEKENPYWEYRIDEYKFANGNTGVYHYVNSRGSSMLIPIMDDGKIILTKQYRYLNQKVSLEFPGGGQENGLSNLENAKKELQEETGYSSENISKIGEFNPCNGVTNEICSVYTAKNLEYKGAKPEESEEIELVFMTVDEVKKAIVDGTLWDGMTLASWSIYSNQIEV